MDIYQKLEDIEAKVQTLVQRIQLLETENRVLEQTNADLQKQVAAGSSSKESVISTSHNVLKETPDEQEVKANIAHHIREIDEVIAQLNKN